MSYLELIREIGTDAEKLETSYRTVVAEGDEQAFVAAIDGAYTDDPENLLYAAWHYRLAYALADRLDEWRIDLGVGRSAGDCQRSAALVVVGRCSV